MEHFQAAESYRRNSGKNNDEPKYIYRDFSHVQERDTLGLPQVQNAWGKQQNQNSIQSQKFPFKLYAILSRPEYSHIVSWMPHGRSWKVLKSDAFEAEVLPKYFEYANYHSFNRLINAWSFRRVRFGPDRGSYYHELFLRGLPHLCKHMRRLPKTHKKAPMNEADEPDFYAMSITSPVPKLLDRPPFQERVRQAITSTNLPPSNLAQTNHEGENIKMHAKDNFPQTFREHNCKLTLKDKKDPHKIAKGMAPKSIDLAEALVSLSKGSTDGKKQIQNISPLQIDISSVLQSYPQHVRDGNRPVLIKPTARIVYGPCIGFMQQRLRHLQHLQDFQRNLGALASELYLKELLVRKYARDIKREIEVRNILANYRTSKP